MSTRPWIVEIDQHRVRSYASMEVAFGHALSAVVHRDGRRARVSHRRTGPFLMIVAMPAWETHVKVLRGIASAPPS